MFKSIGLAFLFASAQVISAQSVMSGTGIIHVISTKNEDFGNKADKIGCLSTTGELIKPATTAGCGVYTAKDGFLTTSAGNCTWEDTTQPLNKENPYGGGDNAWSCSHTVRTGQEDNHFFVNFGNTDTQPFFVGHGENNWFYDVKGSDVWTFSWGSTQFGITPGHTEANWLWELK